jgi:hypothetical protein
MPTYERIEQLPDFPAIQQIQSALWRKGESRGAAVLVGAGFSRNAVLPAPNSPKPPLWTDFYRIMATRLYPSGNAPFDPLRLAEEYKAALGPAAVESLISELVRDGEWVPGELHSKLVSLPWADILTTNWDTLLERAALTSDQQTYETVRTVTDIAHARSPRIVKLHGSLPSNRPFIFTEEDYRTFPRQFAPFVNLVQQIFLENELCLIGFSGDDPNFLQWSGWVRDELGAAARRIYLVGVLNLSPSRRKLLEARFVSPVDLALLVEGEEGQEKHSKASARFLEFLINSKPKPASEWLSDASSILFQRPLAVMFPFAPATESETRSLVASFTDLARIWRAEREAYPGWLVCPESDRERIRLDSSHVEMGLKRASEQLDVQVLYEALWRLDLAFLPSSPWLCKILSKAVEESTSGLDARQEREIAAILLRTAREECDRASFDHWLAFLHKSGDSDEDALSTAAYESCLWGRDHLDYDSVATLVPNVKGDDPAWKIKAASLYYELGESETATNLVVEALRQARARYFRDRRSIWNISRLAWALFLLRANASPSRQLRDAEQMIASKEWPDYVTKNKCLPWDELDALDRKINEAFRTITEADRNESRRFDAGSYTTTMIFSSSLGSARYDTARLADTVGLPAEMPTEGFTADVMRSRLSQMLELSEGYGQHDLLRTIRVLGGQSDKLLEKTFGRIEVAKIPENIAEAVIDALWRAIEFERGRFVSSSARVSSPFSNFRIERLRIFIEVLSRLVVRLTGERAVATFRKATSLVGAAEWRRQFRLFGSFKNFLDRSFSAVSPTDRGSVLLDIVNLPLPDERGIQGESRVKGATPADEWPEMMLPPIVGRSSDQAAFASRIAVLISKVRTGDGLTRERAAIRLAYLYGVGTLTADEAKSFGEAIWSIPEFQSDVFRQIALRPRVVFDLPGSNKAELTALFRSSVLERTWEGLSVESLGAIADAATIRDGSRAFALTPHEAIKLFDLIVGWQSSAFGVIGFDGSRMKEFLGRALADAVLPLVELETLGSERIDRLLDKNEKGRTADYMIVSLPHIVRLDRAREKKVVEQILKAASSRQAETVVSGLVAIQRWRLLSQSGALDKVPPELRQMVVTIVAAARDAWLSSALNLAGEFAEDQELDDGDKRELTNALDRLWGESSYGIWDTRDPRTVTITLIRAGCVRLAEKLRNAGVKAEPITSWIDSAKGDPVPEVRYALSRSGE